MEFYRYKFSEEMKNTLAGFRKKSQNCRQRCLSDEQWKLLLPKNQQLLNELDDINKPEIVEIINSSTEEELPHHDQAGSHDSTKITISGLDGLMEQSVDSANNVEKEENTNLSISDLVTSIEDQLNYSKEMNITHLLKIIFDYKSEDLNDLFSKLHNSLTNDLVYNLGKNILMVDDHASNLIAHYLRILLFPRLFLENNILLESLFLLYLEKHLNITSEYFSKTLNDFNVTPKYTDNLNALKSQFKQKLLRDFSENATKLHSSHFAVIDALLTEELDLETSRKLIQLANVSSATFQTDKDFGKLLLNLVKHMGKNVAHFHRQLKGIAEAHQSIWRNKLRKLIDDCFDGNLQSQNFSIRY